MNKIDLDDENKNIQLDQFFSITNNDPRLMRELLQALMIELNSFLTSLTHIDNEEQYEGFRKSAHKITPSLIMLGQELLLSRINKFKEAYVSNHDAAEGLKRQMHVQTERIIKEVETAINTL